MPPLLVPTSLHYLDRKYQQCIPPAPVGYVPKFFWDEQEQPFVEYLPTGPFYFSFVIDETSPSPARPLDLFIFPVVFRHYDIRIETNGYNATTIGFTLSWLNKKTRTTSPSFGFGFNPAGNAVATQWDTVNSNFGAMAILSWASQNNAGGSNRANRMDCYIRGRDARNT